MQRSIPLLRNRLIARPRLLDALRHWRDYRVVRIEAPAGFGKTTLAALWLRDAATQGAGHVWWSLSQEDNAEDVFLQNLGAIFESHSQKLRSARHMHSAGQVAGGALFDEILYALNAGERTLLLVIDDVHLLRSPACIRILQRLIDGAPPRMHFALLARPPMRVDLTPLRMHGQLLDFDTHDLRLDAAEAAALIDQSRAAHIDDPQRRSLFERSGGWIAGMQLALQSLPASVANRTQSTNRADSHTDVDASASVAFLQSMADAEERWHEHFEREIIQRLAPELQRFLAPAAALPYLEPDLCSAALQQPADVCAQLLRRSAAETGFFIRFRPANGASIFRIHPILKAALMRRFRLVTSTTEQRELRRRATLWLAQHDQVDAALAMLLPADDDEPTRTSDQFTDVEFAADLVERACRPALLRADLMTVRRWLGRIPEDIVRTRPRLALEACWTAVHGLDPQLRTHLARLQSAIAGAAERGEVVPHELTSEVAVLYAMCAAFEGQFTELDHALQVAARVAPAPGSIADGYLHALRAYHLGPPQRGSADRIRELYEGFAVFGRLGFVRGQVEASSLAGLIAASDGGRSVEEYATAIEFIRQVGWERSSFGMQTHLWFSENLYNRNEVRRARHHLLRAIELASDSGDAAGIEPHARVYLQLCDLAEGRSVAEDLDSGAATTQWKDIVTRSAPRLIYVTLFNRLVCSLKLGRTAECWQMIQDFGLHPDHIDPHTVPFAMLCTIAGALFSGRNVQNVGALLDRFIDRLDTLDYPNMTVRAHILKVIYLEHIGSRAQALQLLRDVLQDVERMQMPRLVCDLPMLTPLLRLCDTPFAAQLLELGAPAAPTGRPFGLSEQEVRVLRLLAQKHSPRDIAAELYVAYDTVRKHLKSCYRKMNVHGQVAAVQTAREQGIL